MITYPQFKAKYPPGSQVCSPEGTYCGQCVSYVRQYMAQVHGVKTAPLGNAVDFATNPTFLSYYRKVSDSERRVGDIMIWADDPGTWTGEAGHDAIYDGTDKMMNQNFDGSLKVSRNTIFSPGFIGYYRKKGDDVIGNENHVKILFRQFVNREPTAAEIKDYKGKDLAYALGKLFKARVDVSALVAENKTLKANTTELKPGKYLVT